MALVPQNMITALPIWDAKERQTFRQFYCDGAEEMAAIQMRHDRVIPWMIYGHATAPTYVYLVRVTNGVEVEAIDITARLTIATGTFDGKNYTYDMGAIDITNMGLDNNNYTWNGSAWSLVGDKSYNNFVNECGLFYLEFNFAGTQYWSELLQISTFAEFSDSTDIESNRTRLECVNGCAIGDLPASIISQKIFIKSPTANPEYSTVKDVGENGDDDTTDLWVKMLKRYKVTFFAVETVADWIASIPLYTGSSVLTFTDQYGFTGPIKDFAYNIQWPDEQNGCLALVEISFIREYIA